MYRKVPNDMKFVEREKEVLAFWQEEDIFKKAIRPKTDTNKTFVLYDGPPTANGKPHIGHIKTRVIKDVIPRYHGMKGDNVEFKAGWDTHGLPVELEVEKLLGIDGKPAIEEFGVEPFIQQCKTSVWKYKDEWEQMSKRVGFWADMENPYVTYDNSYIESEWWALKTIWDKGLLYKGHKIVPYCPRCGTSLSSHEVAQGYKSVKENSIFVRFKVKEQKDSYFIAWTTTPWTLPSNVGLCVNPETDYVKIKTVEQEETSYYYMAKSLVESLFEDYEIVETFVGQDLVDLQYESLFPYSQQAIADSKKTAFRVVADRYVTTNDGSGIVHIAPAFGEDDARVGKVYDLPFVQLVKEDGTFPEEALDLAGIFVKDADILIIKKLAKEKKLLKKLLYEHDYPFCWRCDTALIYYARSSWFVEVTKVKEQLIRNNKSVHWLPDNIKDGRMGNFLENVVDWGISRERYWGTPLPVWECECGHRHCVGSIQELKEKAIDCPEEIELHKPYVDQVHLMCDQCQGTMTRVTEVIDCWFDSGAMPFAQYHYPFENKEHFESHYPSQFISEALDQTRGWFYSLLAIGTLLFDSAPFENCLVMGLVQDKDGIKMSKHKGNVVDPWEILNVQGADAARWHFYNSSAPWLPSRFSSESVAESQRKFMGTLWNTYAFYIMYAEIDSFDPNLYHLDYEKLSVMDKWVLSKLHSLLQLVDQKMAAYDITASTRGIEGFVDELSNWYVRRGRERYWGKEMTQDKINAYMTLYTVLEQLIRLSAPFVPFLSENIYQNLVRSVCPHAPISIHLTDYPAVDISFINEDLETQMAEVQKIVIMGRAARNIANIKNRQPLASLSVISPAALANEFIPIVQEELNIKEVIFLKDSKDLFDYRFKPQLRTLGKKLGNKLNSFKNLLEELSGIQTMKKLREKGEISLVLDGETMLFKEEDFIIEAIPFEGFVTQVDKEYTVALNTRLSEELIEEGFVREIISKIQMQRKEAGFEVVDRIFVYYETESMLGNILAKNQTFIGKEVLAEAVLTAETVQTGFFKEWSINSHTCKIWVEKIQPTKE